MPVVSAQLLLLALIYLTLNHKRLPKLYKWYSYFLLTIIIFLFGRACKPFVTQEINNLVFYTRVSLLFAAGMPSLIIANLLYSDTKMPRMMYLLPFLIGLIISAAYVFCLDSHDNKQYLLSSNYIETWFSIDTKLLARHVQLGGIFILSIVPSTYFLTTIFLKNKDIREVSFLSGSLIFGVLYAIGVYWQNLHWIHFLGSIIPALFWAWLAFKDIHDMKSKVSLLKNELYELVASNDKALSHNVDKLLIKIEHLSSNNLNIYKLRLKEILSHLTDNTIEAGGDSGGLLLRYAHQEKIIENEENVEELKKITRTEVEVLSQIMADIPNQHMEKIKRYIIDNYQENIEINQLAARFNISRSYLMSEFKKTTTQTVNQYLTARRIEVAKTLLADYSVTDTAFSVGFNSSNYFSTVFKKSTGETPINYQKSLS
jgi:AraC-like DNA-binding protein